ncbi:MAG: DNA-processing protein DprA [Nitrosopumilaceae archaeon]
MIYRLLGSGLKKTQSKYFNNGSGMTVMEMLEGSEYSSMSAAELLGRTLNDVEAKHAPKILYLKGPMEIPLPRPRVSIIGTRQPSPDGLQATKTFARTLVEKQTVIVSGLAKGIDTAAHKTAIMMGGKTIAVIGTSLNKAYPRENAELQQEIMSKHLVISQFPVGYPTTRKNFVIRNRTMALISDATIIVEAGNTSGSLHQCWETLRLGRPLFIWKSVFDNAKLTWPKEMLEYGAMKLSNLEEIFEFLPSHLAMPDLFH